MSIGLYDQDMATYTLVPYNLELMKLATYYKNRREIVVLSKKFEPYRFEKFFLRKDYDDGNFIPSMSKEPNLSYGGYAFTDGIYVPMAREIEICKPDTSIYEKMRSDIESTTSKDRKKIYQNLSTAEHCRISLDGKTIWDEYSRQFKNLKSSRNIIFHDYDLGKIDGGFEEVKKILSRARTDGWATRVGMKFPVSVSTGEDLLKWISLNPNSTFFSLRYDGVIDDDTFIKYVSEERQRALYTQLDYNVTASSSTENDFITNWIRKIFRQVIIARSYRVFFSLKYDEDFFVEPMWPKVLELINFYHNSLSSKNQATYLNKIGNDTLYDFAVHTLEKPQIYARYYTRSEIREIFAFVREAYYPLFQDFYECNVMSLEEEGLL